MSDFIKWTGGECPVAPHTKVQIISRDGSTCAAFAENIRWSSQERPGDVVSYRVIDDVSVVLSGDEGAPIDWLLTGMHAATVIADATTPLVSARTVQAGDVSVRTEYAPPIGVASEDIKRGQLVSQGVDGLQTYTTSDTGISNATAAESQGDDEAKRPSFTEQPTYVRLIGHARSIAVNTRAAVAIGTTTAEKLIESLNAVQVQLTQAVKEIAESDEIVLRNALYGSTTHLIRLREVAKRAGNTSLARALKIALNEAQAKDLGVQVVREDEYRVYEAACKTLDHLGYEYRGGEMWAPPVGKKPAFAADELLDAAAAHMRDRIATYDKPEGERSMKATVDAFNTITGNALKESEGWLLMALLKMVRSQSRGAPHRDSVEDLIAYCGLFGEARLGGK